MRALIESLHRSRMKAALVLTGGGTTAAAQLLGVPGGSRTILEVAVPYHENALCEYLGFRPEQFCSSDTAIAMAERALDRGRALAPGEPLAGLGVTASLATDRPKRGAHRFYTATATAETITTVGLVLRKGARDRDSEEAVLDAILLNQLAGVFGVKDRLPVPLLAGEDLRIETRPRDDLLPKLLQGQLQCVCQQADARLRTDAAKPLVVLAGAFNPLHEAHRELARVAEKLLVVPAAFELSVMNVDKPPLEVEEVRRRARQFQWLAPLWLTRAATFAEKAGLFPGATFVVGMDTAARIIDARYYGDSAELMSKAREQLHSQGCRFLVAGRRGADGRFESLTELSIPAEWRDFFTPIPEHAFHFDLSSTELRERTSPPVPSPIRSGGWGGGRQEGRP